MKNLDDIIKNETPWRAKEILQGRLSHSDYDSERLEAYGSLLLSMGDALEAGKYLYVSGSRIPRHQDAIELYLTRYGTNGLNQIFSSFPRCVQYSSYNKLSKSFIDNLEKINGNKHEIRQLFKNKILKRERGKPEGSGKILGYFIFAAIIILIIGFFTMAVKGLLWLVELAITF